MNPLRLPSGQHFGSLIARREFGDIVCAENTYGPRTELPQHAHAASYLCLVTQGSFDEVTTNSHGCYSARSVLFRPADETHRQIFGPRGATCFTLTIPQRIASRATADTLFDPRRDYGRTSAALVMHEARREHCRPDSTSALYLEGMLLELLALTARATTRSATHHAVRRAQELLAAAPVAPPTCAAIARELDADPAVLARAFRDHVGCSMAEFARRVRLASAVRMLATSDQPISVIAAEHGFYDQSHFGRHCRRRFGLSPVALRRAGRSGIVPIDPASS